MLACGCLKSAQDYLTRNLASFPKSAISDSLQESILAKVSQYFGTQDTSLSDINVDDFPERTFVRRELYLWNTHEPDRFSPESIRELNEQLDQVAPRLEARVTELPVLHESSSSKCVVKSLILLRNLDLFSFVLTFAGLRNLLTANQKRSNN